MEEGLYQWYRNFFSCQPFKGSYACTALPVNIKLMMTIVKPQTQKTAGIKALDEVRFRGRENQATAEVI
jgi:hypothetical protein